MMLLVFYLGCSLGACTGLFLGRLFDRERAHPRRPDEEEQESLHARTMAAVRLNHDYGLDVRIPRAERLVIAPERLN